MFSSTLWFYCNLSCNIGNILETVRSRNSKFRSQPLHPRFAPWRPATSWSAAARRSKKGSWIFVDALSSLHGGVEIVLPNLGSCSCSWEIWGDQFLDSIPCFPIFDLFRMNCLKRRCGRCWWSWCWLRCWCWWRWWALCVGRYENPAPIILSQPADVLSMFPCFFMIFQFLNISGGISNRCFGGTNMIFVTSSMWDHVANSLVLDVPLLQDRSAKKQRD